MRTKRYIVAVSVAAVLCLLVATLATAPGCVSAAEQQEEARRFVAENPDATQPDVLAHLEQWTQDQMDMQWDNAAAIITGAAGMFGAGGAAAGAVVTGLVNGYRGRRKIGDAKATAISQVVANVFAASGADSGEALMVNKDKLRKLNDETGIQPIVAAALKAAKVDAA